VVCRTVLRQNGTRGEREAEFYARVLEHAASRGDGASASTSLSPLQHFVPRTCAPSLPPPALCRGSDTLLGFEVAAGDASVSPAPHAACERMPSHRANGLRGTPLTHLHLNTLVVATDRAYAGPAWLSQTARFTSNVQKATHRYCVSRYVRRHIHPHALLLRPLACRHVGRRQEGGR
jgi:hypothetical protein